MKQLYCANCGQKLTIIRKALPKYETIIDLIEYHKCLTTPIEIDLEPVDPPKPVKGKDKFVQKLNDLNPSTVKPTFGGVSTEDLRDRRFDPGSEIKSTAPKSILSVIDKLDNSKPEHPIENPESEE